MYGAICVGKGLNKLILPPSDPQSRVGNPTETGSVENPFNDIFLVFKLHFFFDILTLADLTILLPYLLDLLKENFDHKSIPFWDTQ